MDCAWSRSMSQNCAPHSGLPQSCSALGYALKFPMCNNGTATQSYRPWWTGTKGKVTTFLDESSPWTKPGFAHTNQTWNADQMNGNISSKESVSYKICCEGDVYWGVWHFASCSTSKADGKCSQLLHVPAAPSSSSAQEKTSTLGDTEPNHSIWQCKESHRCCCHEPLAPLQWEILDHPPYSPNMNPCDYDLFSKVKESLNLSVL